MNAPSMLRISSRDNALIKDLRRLSQENGAYRKQQRYWAEGDHLCRAALVRGMRPDIAVFAESFLSAARTEYVQAATKNIVVPDALFHEISGLESPASMGYVFALPRDQGLKPGVATVILDRVQDAGNVGSILRSASAFGVEQVLALKGTAALWGSKVLRAGMGAHWGLRLFEGFTFANLDGLDLPIVVTSSHRGEFLHVAQYTNQLPNPCAWVFGHEGQGVCTELEAMARVHIRIAQPGGEESLNVGAAAAICLHASASQAPSVRA
ncbi:TrmH family RNA methyltransferase [Rhodoferax aquaticus]|uniref:RNA methyltransferase n=1 Tax=Rhodoferax aquaticus TaxID=2527691 RepID=A0A515ENT1_9BURK|nr:RNA methyltransferase [Rhodoferax aquaticus]QDL54319.1 RNA methyltransferase [Rhodoferax aquaticus]